MTVNVCACVYVFVGVQVCEIVCVYVCVCVIVYQCFGVSSRVEIVLVGRKGLVWVVRVCDCVRVSVNVCVCVCIQVTENMCSWLCV